MGTHSHVGEGHRCAELAERTAAFQGELVVSAVLIVGSIFDNDYIGANHGLAADRAEVVLGSGHGTDYQGRGKASGINVLVSDARETGHADRHRLPRKKDAEAGVAGTVRRRVQIPAEDTVGIGLGQADVAVVAPNNVGNWGVGGVIYVLIPKPRSIRRVGLEPAGVCVNVIADERYRALLEHGQVNGVELELLK